PLSVAFGYKCNHINSSERRVYFERANRSQRSFLTVSRGFRDDMPPMKIWLLLRVIIYGVLLALFVPPSKVEAGKTPKSLVKIGVLASLTGSGFSLGRNTVAALQIAAQDLKSIGPQYRPVQFRFLVRDTQQNPSRALDAIQDLNARGVKII